MQRCSSGLESGEGASFRRGPEWGSKLSKLKQTNIKKKRKKNKGILTSKDILKPLAQPNIFFCHDKNSAFKKGGGMCPSLHTHTLLLCLWHGLTKELYNGHCIQIWFIYEEVF